MFQYYSLPQPYIWSNLDSRARFRYISHHSPLACILLPLDHVNCSNSFLYHILPVLYTVGQRYQRTI